MRRTTRLVLALVLAAGSVPSAAAQSHPQGLLQCGTRPSVRYAAVFDASSSVRRNPPLRALTETRYAALLRAFSSILCQNDSLTVYAFPRDSSEFMSPLLSISSATRTPPELLRAAQRVMSTHTSHTDLQLTLTGVQRDILQRNAADAVFMITDGSFFPATPVPSDRTVSGLTMRLDALAEYAANTLRPDSGRLHVIGVNAGNVYAIDRDLQPSLGATADQRLWQWGGQSLDLRDDKGDDLLRAVFGSRFIPADSLSLWKMLIAQPGALWTNRLGYVTGWEFPLSEYRTFSIEHILFIPDDHASRPMVCPGEEIADAGKQIAAVHDGVGEFVFCSLSNPSREELERLRKGVHHFAFLQQQSLRAVRPMTDLAGLHQLTLHDGRGECNPEFVPAYFNRGEPWPPSSSTVGSLRFSPTDSILWSTPVPIVRLPGSDCLVPRFEAARWSMPKGQYLLQIQHDKTSIHPVSFQQASDSISVAFIRPGGLPFPSDQIALVRVCVHRSEPLATSDRMWMILDEKPLPLTPERGKQRCGASTRGSVTGFSGLVIIRSPDIHTARILVGSESAALSNALSGMWTPVTLRLDGRLFLSWTGLILIFLAGFLVQLLYLCCWKKPRFRFERLLWGSAWTGAIISGIVCAVVAEFVILVAETNVATDQVPVIFALSVLAHMAKLVAAALVSEHVEEFILSS